MTNCAYCDKANKGIIVLMYIGGIRGGEREINKNSFKKKKKGSGSSLFEIEI